NGVSRDQMAAKAFSEKTQLGSLELALEPTELLGACDQGYSCAYTNTLSWRAPTVPVPVERNPRAVFERLFGTTDSTAPAVRLARIRKDRSILDWVAGDLARLQATLGPIDRSKIGAYVDAMRDAETRSQ